MARRKHEEEYEEEYERGSLAAAFYDASWRRAAIVPLILILFGSGAWMMWKKYKDEVLNHSSYNLDTHTIQYTVPPAWLKRDVLAEVVQHGSLESAKIHKSGLTVLVANAFEHHPWVKRVTRVRLRYPAKLSVELIYREPIAMVALPDDDPSDEEAWMLPIDNEAVLLPPQDFTQEFAASFPRIDVGHSVPAGSPGTGWGDDVIVDAAKLAELLYEDWDNLKSVLYQIERSSQPTTTATSPDFDIRGRDDLGPTPTGLLIHWGRAPGKELGGEPTAAAKLAYLKEWIRTAKPPTGVIDLRSARAMQAAKPGHTRR